jgi:hypothetical protein
VLEEEQMLPVLVVQEGKVELDVEEEVEELELLVVEEEMEEMA